MSKLGILLAQRRDYYVIDTDEVLIWMVVFESQLTIAPFHSTFLHSFMILIS